MQETSQDPVLQDCIQSVTGAKGIIGAALVDPEGKFLAHRLSAPYEPVLLTSLLEHLAAVQDLMVSLDPATRLRSFLGKYEELAILVRWTDRYTVVMLAAPNVNMAMMSVAAAAMQTKADAALSRPKAGPLLRTYPTNPGTVTVSGVEHQAPREGNTASDWRTGNAVTPSSATTSEFVPLDTLKAVVKALAQHTGPTAQALIKRELANRGVTAVTLKRAQYQDFLSTMSQQISDPGARTLFMNEASALA
jgi:hypothetical protein